MRKLHWFALGIFAAALFTGCGSTIQQNDTGGGGSDGALMVRSDPAGAAIAVNGQPTGKVTPADVAGFAQPAPTENVVTLTLAGRSAWSGLAVVNEGSTFTLQATLMPSSTSAGSLEVQSDPQGATVFLDGEDTGATTPATLPTVTASQHVVEYRLAGFYPFREVVAVGAGRASQSAPTLTRLGQGRVTGRVIDDEGNGIVGAQIGVRDQDASTTTSAFGIFVLPNVPQGSYTLDAAVAAGSTTLRGSREGVTVTAGGTTANADILTAPGGANGKIGGTVLDSSQRPIADAEIFASVAVAPGFLPDSTVFPYRATADGNGRFTLQSLPPGFWVLTAAYPGYATVTKGISPQIQVYANQTASVEFTLPASSAAKPAAPRQLWATAFTLPTVMTRSPSGYEAIRDRILRRAWGARYDLVFAQRATLKAPAKRTAPPGSLIEVDVSWNAPGDPDIVGYYVGRSLVESTGYQLIEDLLNPHAGLWIDYDARLSPGTSYFYRVTSVNARGVNSDPSNTATAVPMGQITVRSPVDTASSATPLLDWNALPGAFLYDVQVFDGYPERMTSPLWEANALSGSVSSVPYSGPALQSQHTYYWVVAARNSADPEAVTGWSISRITPFTIP